MSNIINYLSDEKAQDDFIYSIKNISKNDVCNLYFNGKYAFSNFELKSENETMFVLNVYEKETKKINKVNTECIPVGITLKNDDEVMFYVSNNEVITFEDSYIVEHFLKLGVYIQQKALNSRKEVVKIVSDVPREIKNNVSQRDTSKSSINLDNGVVFTHIYDNARHYNRHAESWGVRGHYRHYKSGKVVFIPPHKKGKGEIKDKTYII